MEHTGCQSRMGMPASDDVRLCLDGGCSPPLPRYSGSGCSCSVDGGSVEGDEGIVRLVAVQSNSDACRGSATGVGGEGGLNLVVSSGGNRRLRPSCVARTAKRWLSVST